MRSPPSQRTKKKQRSRRSVEQPVMSDKLSEVRTMLTTVEQAIGDATLPDLYHAHGTLVSAINMLRELQGEVDKASIILAALKQLGGGGGGGG
jgi:hypothetical protein